MLLAINLLQLATVVLLEGAADIKHLASKSSPRERQIAAWPTPEFRSGHVSGGCRDTSRKFPESSTMYCRAARVWSIHELPCWMRRWSTSMCHCASGTRFCTCSRDCHDSLPCDLENFCHMLLLSTDFRHWWLSRMPCASQCLAYRWSEPSRLDGLFSQQT
jgi:hypothetical protein